MSKETFQLSGSAASIYEEQKVPAMFGPLADATLSLVPLFENDQVIDLACGTGIVARKVRQKLGAGARIVGVDLNKGMIEIARNLTDQNARSCDWHVCNVTELPFESETFTMAFCQQGIQYFPDTVAALREIERVLRPGGRLSLTVWDGPSDFFIAIASALRERISEEAARQSLAPFSFGEIDKLTEDMQRVGFREITSQLLTVDRTIGSQSAIAREILANPVGPKVAERGEEVMANIVAEVSEVISVYRQGSGFVVPQRTRLIQAKVG